MNKITEEWMSRGIERDERKKETKRLSDDFKSIDQKAIKRMSDADLAEWRAQYPADSPHAFFVEQQWKYRAIRRTWLFSIITAIVSALLGGTVGYFLHSPANCATDQKAADHQPPVNPAAGLKPKT